MYEKLHPRLTRPSEPILRLGTTRFRNRTQTFGQYQTDRLRHTWIIGKTGSGKSTLLLNLIAQDLQQGRGLALLDPHGDLVAAVLAHVPANRAHQVALVSPADTDWPQSFNVFRLGRERLPPPEVSSQLIAVFKKQWADAWGPRLEHLLRNAILAVAEDPRATLLHLYRFVTNESLRTKVVERLHDPVVRDFWQREFVAYGPRLQAEALAPVLNKVGAFIANPTLRNIVGQERSRLDLVALMDQGGILLADLSIGKIGDDASRLLGGLLLASLQLSAMRRAPGSRPFFLYVDEFQNFVTDALATMLAESRKFGLGLVLAHQYLAQLPDALSAAVRGNVGTVIAFRLGAQDAQDLEGEFAPVYTATDLIATPARTAVVKLLVDGTQTNPFLADMQPPAVPPADAAQRERIVALSRERHCRPKEAVDAFVNASLS
jgi:energy-coupling factor transporter ATP-binding protein EcfA2